MPSGGWEDRKRAPVFLRRYPPSLLANLGEGAHAKRRNPIVIVSWVLPVRAEQQNLPHHAAGHEGAPPIPESGP
jgi:hypothetical protein